MNFQAYINQPWEKWHNGLFYIPPNSLPWGDWKQWGKYIKETHPVQYFFRETIVDWFVWKRKSVHDFNYKIKTYFCPKQKWLTKDVPNSWVDKNWLIEHLLEKILVHFVEEEKCFEVIDTKQSEDKTFWAELRYVYKWFKVTKPSLQKKIDDLMTELYSESFNSENLNKPETTQRKRKQKKLEQLEEKLEKELTFALNWVTNCRNKLWT